MKKSIITNSHDQFFRESMKDKRVAKEFLATHLPPELCALMDMDQLVLQPRSQSNAVRRESIVDLLFKTAIAGKEAYIYLLLEHQSSPDPLMAFRILEYTVNAIRDHIKQHRTNKIPLIIPLVIYHGQPYQFKRDVRDLVDAPKEIVEQYFLKPFQLVDLNEIQDEELKQHQWSGVMEFTLKHIFKRDMLPYLYDIAPLLKKLTQQDGKEFVGLVLQYIIGGAEISDDEALIDLINTEISDELGEKFMTAIEKWIQQGMEKGKLEGKLELVEKMLLNGVEPAFISKNTGITLNQVKEIQDKLKK
jgi:recombination-promoting nuclease RpnB